MTYAKLDPARARVLGEAVRGDGTTFPWAVRSRNLTYVGEIPFPYTSETDRVLVFADLLFDLLAPGTPERHRALVRLEDIDPTSDPSSSEPPPTTCTARAFPSASASCRATATRREARTTVSPATSCCATRRTSSPRSGT